MHTAITIRPTIDTARTFADEIAARATEAESLGTMPPDLVARIRAAGLLRILQPRALGGHEIEPTALIDIVEELARADGSAGWTVAIGAGGPAFTAWLEPDVARDLFGTDADMTAATVFAPTGRLVPREPGTFTLSGRWPFASGCRHAEWLITGAFVFDGDAPRMLPGQGPDWRLAFIHRAAGEIVDNWDVLGLRATGSNDLKVDRALVREEHTAGAFFSPARHDGPLWRLPFFTLAGAALVGVPLGIGRRALDEITVLAPAKTRAGTSSSVADDPNAQVDLARAEARLLGARALVFDTLGSIWDTACAGAVPSIEQRAGFQLAAQGAMQAGIDAVDVAFALAGSTAVRSAHPIERCFRDIHTAAQHAYFSTGALQRFAKTRFAIEQPTFMM
jgi:alkylation response protein AidB-like acyl-CoA dehydrogenase